MSDITPNRVLVAFGSNLGDRERAINSALLGLERLSTGYFACSSWWRSAPAQMAAGAGQFINGVVALDTLLTPLALLRALQRIERDSGRPLDHGFNESRILDLDIIWYADRTIELPELVIPHPRALERGFVLVPMWELMPNLMLPGQARPLAALIADLPADTLSRWSTAEE